MECGAVDGELLSSTKFFEESLGWKSIKIEPNADFFAKLETNRPKSININVALSDSEGEAYLSIRRGHYLDAHIVDTKAKNTLPVQKAIFRNVVAGLPVDHIDLMVLDVEGHEQRAMAGMIGSRILPTVLCVEVNHSDKSQIKALAEEMGYCYDFSITINHVYVKK